MSSIVYDAQRNLIYLTQDGQVLRWDVARERFLPSVNLGGALNGLDITPDGDFLYVAQSELESFTQVSYSRIEDGVAVIHRINLGNRSVTDITYEVSGLERGTYDLAISASGLGFITTEFAGSGWNPLRALDTADDSLAVWDELPRIRQESYLTSSEDDRYILFQEANSSRAPIHLYDSFTDEIIATDELGRFSTETAAVSSAAGLVAFRDGVRDFSLNVVEDLSRYGLIQSLAFSPDGAWLFLAHVQSDEIVVLDTTSWSVVDTINAGFDIDYRGNLIVVEEGETLLLRNEDDSSFVTIDFAREFDPTSNERPLPQADAFTLSEDSAPAILDVLANDGDPDYWDWLDIFAVDASGALGMVSVRTDGSGVVYNPNGAFDHLAAGQVMTDSFTYFVTDQEGGTAAQTVTVTITGREEAQAGQSLAADADKVYRSFYDEARGFVYFTTYGGLLQRWNAETQRFEAPLDLGGHILGMDLSPDGQYLYVAQRQLASFTPGDTWYTNVGEALIHKVDLNDWTVDNIFYTVTGNELGTYDLAIANTGLGLFSTGYAGSGFNPFRQIDVADDSLSRRADLATINQNTHFDRSESGRFILIQEADSSSGPLHLYDASTDRIVAYIDLFDVLGHPEFSISYNSGFADINEEAGLIAVSYGQAVMLFDMGLNPVAEVVRVIPNETDSHWRYMRDVAFSEDGRLLYILSWGAGAIHVVNTVDLTLVTTIDLRGFDLFTVDDDHYVSTALELTEDYIVAVLDGGVEFVPIPEIALPIDQIGGTIFLDYSANGFSDGDDAAVGGVEVGLLRDGTVVASMITDTEGRFLFEGLDPGRYEVVIGRNGSAPLYDLENSVDPDGGGDDRAVFMLEAGDQTSHFDFGYVPDHDYGDAPDHYGTLAVDNGARHAIGPWLPMVALGSSVAVDEDGQPSVGAALDDDDGITNLVDDRIVLTVNRTGEVEFSFVNYSGKTVRAVLWIDFDGDGAFDEYRWTDIDAETREGTMTLEVSVPYYAVAGDTYARLRISSDLDALLSSTGFAIDGEVEDYAVTLLPTPFANLSIHVEVSDVGGDGPDGVVDGLGDVVLYSVIVENSGNVPLTDVTLSDALSGLEVYIGDLASGETATVSLDYAVTAAEIAAFNGGSMTGELLARSNESPDEAGEVVYAIDVPGDIGVLGVSLSGTNVIDDLWGGAGHDVISGEGGADRLVGRAGNDFILGGASSDELWGQEGDDTLNGGSAHDLLVGGIGDDTLRGGENGFDELWGESGNDILMGWDGDDLLVGGTGNDTLHGNYRHDELWGEDGDDTLFGGSGEDLLVGSFGRDYLDGGAGRDELWGQQDADSLHGGPGNDFLAAGAGDDVLNGGNGDDVLWGEQGADTFIVSAGTFHEWIGDFTPGEDRIDLSAFDEIQSLADLKNLGTEESGYTLFNLGGGDFMTLNGLGLANLFESDFIFA